VLDGRSVAVSGSWDDTVRELQHDATLHRIVLQDPDLNRTPRGMTVAYSNAGTTGSDLVRLIPRARFFDDDTETGEGEAAALYVGLDPMEVQVLVPATS
jgi:hypothetical protein